MEVNSDENDRTIRVAGQKEEEEEEILKKRILLHPLFSLLVETHIDCIKVALGEIQDNDKANGKEEAKLKLETLNCADISEFDLFMEAYCIMLNKLKEAMKEPLQETESFIEGMYKQLNEINENHPEPNSSA
ncbi:protein KNATM [Manihot esculenta]|uniref:Uncharacterized protein n=1 Tax=Manihot esculenta TaxID=3983 RepID=A0ACB7GBF1_MANES|nr:protein KNATM [Manihot esculenta]KAG8637567.1 hypothetical protein MANES_15G136200v8 [Manihot esculenta]